MSVRILLTEDHRGVREQLRILLDAQNDLEVVAEAENGRQALRLMVEHAPQVVVMDVRLPHLNGVEFTRRVSSSHPGSKVVALSTHADKRYVAAMLNAGASAYVLKSSAAAELPAAIRCVTAGHTYLSDKLGGIHPDCRDGGGHTAGSER